MAGHDIYPEALAALRAGEASKAEALARQALAATPDDPPLVSVRALALYGMGMPREALVEFERLTRLSPENAAGWGNYATLLRDEGHLQKAEAAYRKSLQLAPDNPNQLMNFGLLQLQTGDHQGARATLLAAHALDPGSARIRLHAARACVLCRDPGAAALLSTWRTWGVLPIETHYELAELLQSTDWPEDAVDLLRDLLSRSPRHVRAMLLLARLHERLNRLDEAQVLLAKVGALSLDREAHQELLHLRAALLARQGAGEDARTLLLQAGPRSAHDSSHYFALGRACHRSRDVGAAMQAFATAHAMETEELKRVVPQWFEPGAPPLPAIQGAISASHVERWPQLRAPSSDESPVFIVGFPRSGTTLLEQMLDAHPGMQSMDERPFFDRLEERLERAGLQLPGDLGRLGQADCDRLRSIYQELVASKVQRRPDTLLVDKNPANMFRLPLICRLYPKARFILALRHPCDTILSNYMQEYRSPVWSAVSASLERLASAYRQAWDAWKQQLEVLAPMVHVVRYEDLVENTQRQATALAQFLGLSQAASLLDYRGRASEKGYIGTPSYAQVIEPINSRSIGRWVEYMEYFRPILPSIEMTLAELGYSADVRQQ